MPLVASELVALPGFQHVIQDLQPSKKGNVAVARGRGGPLNIAYEVHGGGPVHLVVSSTISSLSLLMDS